MKQVFSGLKTIKVDRPFELYHIEAAKPVTAEVQKREDGFLPYLYETESRTRREGYRNRDFVICRKRVR